MTTLRNVQSAIAGLISANASLAALGTPLQFDIEAADGVTAAAISARLESTGVCIEVGSVTAPRGKRSIHGKITQLTAELEVYAATKIGTSATPKGVLLVETIIAAVCAANSQFAQPVTCTGYDTAASESGYIFHVIGFEVECVVK